MKNKRSTSEDSGFDSPVGFTRTYWPNGKASDYESIFFHTFRVLNTVRTGVHSQMLTF